MYDDGVSYLLEQWEDTYFFTGPARGRYVMFEVTDMMVWTRPTTIVEMISGLTAAGPPLNLGTVPVLKALSSSRRTAEIEASVWDLMTNATIKEGDYLDNLKIRRVQVRRGICSGEGI